jgi:hypothetical protein
MGAAQYYDWRHGDVAPDKEADSSSGIAETAW